MSVVLIGGPSGAGKTTLGRALAAELGADSVTGDDLVRAARGATTSETHPALHAISSVGHIAYFTDTPFDTIETDVVALCAAAGPILRTVIAHRLGKREPVVLDHWATTPEIVRGFGLPDVTPVWINVDPEALRAREAAQTAFFDASHDPDAMYQRFMHRSLWHQARVIEQARALGDHVIDQPGDRPTVDLVDEVLGVLGHNSHDVGSGGS